MANLVDFHKQTVETSITARFESRVEKYPGHCALKTTEQELTYEKLNSIANRIARYICAKGTKDVEVVALLLEPGVAMISAILAVLKAGKIWLPLDPSLPPDRLYYLVKDSNATLVLTTQQHRPLGVKLTNKKHALIDLDAIGDNTSDDNLNLPILPKSYAHIIYTSGSTGQPKGVLHNHRLILHNIWFHTNAFGIRPHDRISLLSPLGYISGISDLFRALLNGATLLPFSLRKMGLASLPAWLKEEGITIFHSVPAVFRQLAYSISGEEFPQMCIVHLGGEVVLKHDVELYKKHFPSSCKLVIILGATEAPTFRYNVITKETELEGDTVAVGDPVEDKEVLLLDDEGREVEPNQAGEIAVRSRYLASGYWRQPEFTRKVFLPNPEGGDKTIYMTGDMGRMRPDGRLIYLGRKDNQFKINGQRVDSSEIEAVLLEYPQIKSCAVVPMENNLGDKYMSSYIVPHTIPAPNASELQRYLKQRLPLFMVPSSFVILDGLPLTLSGKIDRKALAARDSSRELEEMYVAPRTQIEVELSEIWQDVLRIKRVGIHSNFFELGGQSLQAMQMMSLLNASFQIELPLKTFFELPTIAELSSRITQTVVKQTDDEILKLLKEVEGLSEEEALSRLDEEGRSL